jgi:erythronate-4-phosphate dehydrogenase
MKILADENIPLVAEFFQSLGTVVTHAGRTLQAKDASDANALLVRSVTQVNAQLLNKSTVNFVGTCTIGVDHVNQPWLHENNIAFASAPGCNANSVVEYVYAALCHLDVDWRDKKFGIIGCGNVGGLLYKNLKKQHVDCYCYDPFLTKNHNADLTSLEAVLACDIISLHTPLTTSGEHASFHLLNLPELQQLKTGAVLLNCGRGAVINNADLLTFLQQRGDVKVVLDVWEPEPNISLGLLDKVAIGTPHIAGYSYDGKLKGTEMVYHAFCKHVEREATLNLSQLVPPLENNKLVLAAEKSHWQQIKQLVAQGYSIANDDKRLRDLAHANTENFAEGFDDLRKHYPTRREFHNYHIVTQQALDQAMVAWLSALGFTIF